MGREPKTETVGGLRVTSQPLPFVQAEPLLADVGQFIALALEELAKVLDGVDIKALFPADGQPFDARKINLGSAQVSKFGTALRTAAFHLGEGRLAKLAPRIMATTYVDLPDMAGEIQRRDLGKAKDRELVFDEHPEAYLPILWFAGRTTFARYFPVAALIGGETPSA